MEEHGNAKGNAVWAKNVPLCYRQPKPSDAQWVHFLINGWELHTFFIVNTWGYINTTVSEQIIV